MDIQVLFVLAKQIFSWHEMNFVREKISAEMLLLVVGKYVMMGLVII